MFKKQNDLCAVDLGRAFDCASREALRFGMRNEGVSEYEVEWLKIMCVVMLYSVEWGCDSVTDVI